jgi:hypothetical protein
MYKRYILAITILPLMLSSIVIARGDITLKPYVKLGYLLSAPSASDLGYIIVDGSDPDQYLDIVKLNYGIGVQFLFPFNSFSSESFEGSLGFDIGMQKIFSSTFNPGNLGSWGYGGYTYEDNKKDSEYEMYLLGLVEFNHASLPLVLQAGLGLHIVFWEWESDYSSNYSTSYKSESGSGTQLGILVAGGLNLPISERMKLPLMLRIDNIFRYGAELTLSVSAGFVIKI